MPPEAIPALRERLAKLEAQHNGLEEKNELSLREITRRLEDHVEETDRRFAMMESKHVDTTQAVTLLTTTVSDFITDHRATEKEKERQSVKAWQLWGIIIAVVVSPFVQAGITALLK